MKIKYLILSLASSFVMSCTSGFEEMNKNPLVVNETTPDLLLPVMEHYGYQVGNGEYQRANLLYSALYCQYVANVSANFTSGNYLYNSSWAERGFWTPYYQKVLKNFREAEKLLASNGQYEDMYQIMRILTASVTMRQTDVFGDIPYFGAGYGDTQVVYDSQSVIYDDVFKSLKEAVDLLKQKRKDQSKYGKEDLIYQGNVDKWIKFGNSLRLRAAIRLSYVDQAKAKSEGEAALKELMMESNADNAQVITQTIGLNGNPFIQNSYRNEFRASETMINMLTQNSTVSDPRLPLILGKTQAWMDGVEGAQEYKGLPNGLATSDVTRPEYDFYHNSPYWGYMWGFTWNDKGFGGKSAKPNGKIVIPVVIMNYAEVCFLKAEAALRGWSGAGSAKDNYNAGIQASIDEMRTYAPKGSYTTENDMTYCSTGWVKWDAAADFEEALKRIITQKWIAVFPNAVEAWAEFRRTGYPELTPIRYSLEATIKPENGEFIKKLRYVDNELINNGINVNNPNLNGGKGDGVNVRVWWDTGRYK